jgi:hypothetical protein
MAVYPRGRYCVWVVEGEVEDEYAAHQHVALPAAEGVHFLANCGVELCGGVFTLRTQLRIVDYAHYHQDSTSRAEVVVFARASRGLVVAEIVEEKRARVPAQAAKYTAPSC